jgi:calcineurin-like phosphoesterase
LQYLAATPPDREAAEFSGLGARLPTVCTLRKGELEANSVLTLCGQVYMPPCDSPFNGFGTLVLRTNPGHEISACVLVDFHAESTAEKRALGLVRRWAHLRS